MTTPGAPASDLTWYERGKVDAPVALRAIARATFEYGKGRPGYACANAILGAYGQDIKAVGLGVASVHRSEHRLRLLTQLVSDANQSGWFEAFLSAPSDFMAEYRDGFVRELDELMPSWVASPWKPGSHPDLLAEEEKWLRGLAMGDLLLQKPKQGWRKLFGG